MPRLMAAAVCSLHAGGLLNAAELSRVRRAFPQTTLQRYLDSAGDPFFSAVQVPALVRSNLDKTTYSKSKSAQSCS